MIRKGNHCGFCIEHADFGGIEGISLVWISKEREGHLKKIRYGLQRGLFRGVWLEMKKLKERSTRKFRARRTSMRWNVCASKS